jgi:hypothetical protein
MWSQQEEKQRLVPFSCFGMVARGLAFFHYLDETKAEALSLQ